MNLNEILIEFTIENLLVRGGCPRVYIYMVNIVLKPCEILKVVIYHHTSQSTICGLL
jgi:hypothetical protein